MKIRFRVWGAILAGILSASATLPNASRASTEVNICSTESSQRVRVEISQKVTDETPSITVTLRKNRLVVLVAVLEKGKDFIRVVGSHLKVPTTVLITKKTVFKRRGQTTAFAELSASSAIVLLAQREKQADAWKATKAIILRDNVFREMKISVSGVISAIDTTSKKISIKAEDGTVVLSVDTLTLIARDHRPANLSDLKINDQVKVSYRIVGGSLVAVKIKVRSD